MDCRLLLMLKLPPPLKMGLTSKLDLITQFTKYEHWQGTTITALARVQLADLYIFSKHLSKLVSYSVPAVELRSDCEDIVWDVIL